MHMSLAAPLQGGKAIVHTSNCLWLFLCCTCSLRWRRCCSASWRRGALAIHMCSGTAWCHASWLPGSPWSSCCAVLHGQVGLCKFFPHTKGAQEAHTKHAIDSWSLCACKTCISTRTKMHRSMHTNTSMEECSCSVYQQVYRKAHQKY
jgi:hypothetical protein